MNSPAAATAECAVPTSTTWPLERVLFALAGTMTLLSAVLAALVSPWFLLLTGFVGANQWLYVIFGACPASLLLSRLAGLRPAASHGDLRGDRLRSDR